LQTHGRKRSFIAPSSVKKSSDTEIGVNRGMVEGEEL
jgi:hypothetical protein